MTASNNLCRLTKVNEKYFFQRSEALGLEFPWVLQGVELKTIDKKKELHITISHIKGSTFLDEHGEA